MADFSVAAELSTGDDACERLPVVEKRKCSVCGVAGHDRRSCSRRGVKKPRPFDPWSDLEWEEHAEAQRVVAEHPDGMTLEEVGEVLGVTRERVRQIEAAALAKLREATGGMTADVNGLTVAVCDCEKCGQPYVRRGRLRVCEGCSPAPGKPKLRVVKPQPAPEPEPAPVPDKQADLERLLSKFTVIFRF